MKIAIIAPVIRKISTKNLYGGIERIILSLAVGTANAGHEVTLYAPFGTDLKHKNIKIRLTTNQNIIGKPYLIKQAEQKLFQKIVTDQKQFDIIHTHIEPVIAKIRQDNYFAQIIKPVVVTVHNQTYITDNINYYKSQKKIHNLNYVFISHNQAKPLHFLPNQTVIYNGIDLDKFTFKSTPNSDQLAFLGRITPEKGISQAIQIAQLSNKNLLIAASIDKTEQIFYKNMVKPQLNNTDIIYLGEINNNEKNKLLGGSEALLSPIQWREPFGLVMVEAMATGTPVIAPNLGSVAEIIEDGKTGFIIDDPNNIEAYVEKINKITDISREYCRKAVEKKFSSKIMTNNYLKLYSSLIK